tara:strand:+ start:2056 stop:3990 length:1935 start_codon:yes stop_codon:yes gene_type:complete
MRQIYNIKVQFVSLLLLLVSYSTHFSQNSEHLNSVFSSNVKNIKSSSVPISFSGFYRFLGYAKNQNETFPTNNGKTFVLLSGDYYRVPMLLLKLKGLTKDNISFGADFMINSLYKGPAESNSKILTLNLGLNLRTSFKTKIGKFKLSSGGVSWYKQSRLTVWGNRTYNRRSIYDRMPQTALTRTPNVRYEKYYKNGLIDQGIRYGSRAFQGLFFSGQNLPYKFSFKGVLGKSNFNRSIFNNSDNFIGCFRVNKKFNNKFNISYNYLNSVASLDTLTDDVKKYNIHTIELTKKWKKIIFNFETGIGNYLSPSYDFKYGEALIFNIKTVKSVKIPLDIQLYRISPQFVNLTGNFLNTTVLEVFPNISGVGTTVRTPFNSPIVGLGSHTNNRQGISFNAEHSFGNLKINGGLGVFAEIDTSYASLTYSYNVNAQTLSRFNIFRRNWGPYNSLNSIFRRVFEDVSIIDASSTEKASFKKFFNTLEFQAKYKNKIGSHNFYIFSLSRLNSCQKEIKALPQYNLNPTTLISQFSQEFDFSLELNPSTTFIFSYGIERIIGNSLTGIGDQDISLGGNTINNLLENLGFDRFTEKNFSKNQQNRLFGIGLDYKIAKNAMLFIRHNWYKYYDPNFVLNNLRGTETMLEIKILF